MPSEVSVKDISELQAWNAWKMVCWVHGLGRELDSAQPIVGTEADEKLLSKRIHDAFLRKLRQFGDCFVDKESDFNVCIANLDCANEFDNALREYELSETPGHEIYDRRFTSNPRPRKAKAWKDFVWSAISTSKDPPIRLIRGMLLGERGVINRVVEDWIVREYSARIITDPQTHKDALVFDRSKDEPVAGTEEVSEISNEDTLVRHISPGSEHADHIDNVPACLVEENETVSIPDEWKSALEKTFTPKWCCVAFAHFNEVPIYNDTEVLEALGMGHSSAHALVKTRSGELMRELPEELRVWLITNREGTRFFRAWIEKKALLEKAGELLLLRIAKRDNNRSQED